MFLTIILIYSIPLESVHAKQKKSDCIPDESTLLIKKLNYKKVN